MVKITTVLTVFLNISAFCECGVYSAVEVRPRLFISRTCLVGDEPDMFLRIECIFLVPVVVPSEG